MAKKKNGKASKPAGKKTGKRNTKNDGIVGVTRPKKRQPRQQALIEDARIGPLDKLASSIGDCRDAMNELRVEEKGYLQSARKMMHQYHKTVYKHAGVEIVLVPGDEKVRVRILNDNGDASSSGSDDNSDDEQGSDERATPDSSGLPAEA